MCSLSHPTRFSLLPRFVLWGGGRREKRHYDRGSRSKASRGSPRPPSAWSRANRRPVSLRSDNSAENTIEFSAAAKGSIFDHAFFLCDRRCHGRVATTLEVSSFLGTVACRQKYLSDGFSRYSKPKKNSINFALEESKIPVKWEIISRTRMKNCWWWRKGWILFR